MLVRRHVASHAAVQEIFAVVGNVGVVINLCNELVNLTLNDGAVLIGVCVVRRVKGFFLEGLQYLNG